MNAIVDVVQARSMGRSFATDPELQLPVRPRLIPELLVCPLGEDGLLFVGTQSMQVLRGRSARPLLPRLLPLLDGTRTREDLRAMLPELSGEAMGDVLSLLFSRGLLEDGRPADTDRPLVSETASFLGRYNDVSRRNRNRAEASASVAASSVRVHGPAPLVGYVVDQLLEAGVPDVRPGGRGADESDLTIAISTGDAPASVEALQACIASSASTLVVRLGDREGHIGPRLVRGMTVCPACLARMHPHPAGVPSPLFAQLWLGLAAQRAFLDLSRLGPSTRHRALDQLSVDADGRMLQQKRLAPRIPGCRACGIEGEPWALDDPRLLAWLYHEGTTISRRRDLAPKDHQAHYLVSNLKLGVAPGVVIHSSVTCMLPPAKPLDVPVPWARGYSPELARRLSLGALSTLLGRIAGETGEGASRRRIAPTGGNLGSVRLWVLARDVDGLGRGAYLYNAHGHTLAFRGGFDDRELSDGLGTGAELPACVVLGAGDLAKCTQKYQGFAYRLIHFDAGIAVAFAHAVAEGLGLMVREYADFDVRLPEIFRIPRRREFPLPTFALGIFLGAIPAEPRAGADTRVHRPGAALTPDDYTFDVLPRIVASALTRPSPARWSHARVVQMPKVALPPIESLEDVLHGRRAVRQYASTLPRLGALQAIMTVASVTCARRKAAGAPSAPVRPVLTIPSASAELAPGIYELARSQSGPLVRRSGFDSAQARECINQLALARSPASLVLVADLRAALTRRVGRGYSDVAVAAGAAVGMAWLAVCSYGLVGTAAGGVIAHGFREAAGMDGFNECPVLALHFGLPTPS